jgi:uncharacterized repeat protein (TIGR04138 family)
MVNSAEDLLAHILEHDKRYDREAYRFVSEALGFTVERSGRTGHVTGKELCEGMREFALQSFGRLARTVLATWGLRRTEDVGEIVFNMVEAGLLRKTDEDRREDFRDVFSFEEAFDRGFELHIHSEKSDDERREP